MARVRALRGVCIGVDRHLRPSDEAEVDAASAQFLVSIGAVERMPDPPPSPPPATKPPATDKPGKKE